MDDVGPAELVPCALRRVVRVLNEEAAAVAGEHPVVASWLEEIAVAMSREAAPLLG